MTSTLSEVLVDCNDCELVAQFWCSVLGWEVLDRDEEEGDVEIGSPDERIRLRSTQFLATLGDPRGADAIVAAVLNDPVPEVVAAAEGALYRLGARSSDPQIG